MATKNPLIKKAGEASDLTEAQVIEYTKCFNDPLYFIENYVYVSHPVRGQTLFMMYDYQKELVDEYHTNKDVIVKWSRQSGKDLCIETPILTPSGFKRMGDVHPGDYVYGSDGKPTLVIDESPTFTEPNMYEVRFNDGSVISASETHKWTVYNRFLKHKKCTLTTKELLDSNWCKLRSNGYTEYAYYIPTVKPIEFSKSDLLIEPYLLGAWLGDGHSRNAYFTCHDEHTNHFQNQGFIFKVVPSSVQIGKNCRSYLIQNSSFYQKLGLLGVRQEAKPGSVKSKCIPDSYKQAHISDRIALLQGLMDTDGFINSTGSELAIQLTRKNTTLISDVKQLIESLGIKVSTKEFEQTNSTRLSFIITRDQFDAFRIPHKLRRQRISAPRARYSNSRTIVGITELGTNFQSKCISVAAQDHLFCAGTELILTHNSESSCAYLFWFSIFRKDKTVLIASNKHKNSRAMITRIKYMYEHLPMWLKPGVKDDGWNALSLKFDNGCRIESDATSETTGRGGSFSILYLDEVGFVPPRVQELMWASISPTLATGGKLFITSTPNGDADLFATLWRGAEAGTNGFVSHAIEWNQVPGRDEAFKEREISKNGLLVWQQEFECRFLSSEPLLISSIFAQTLKSMEPIDTNHGIKIWKNFEKDYQARALPVNRDTNLNNYSYAEQYNNPPPTKEYNKQCIVTCDPSKGLGGDYTVVTVVEYPTLEQMMEFRSNISATGDIYKILRYIWKKADDAGWEVHFTVENNGVGEGIITLFETDEKLPENVSIVSDDGRQIGMNTNARTKLQACKVFKEMTEAGKLGMKSADIIREIKTYIQTKGSYAAQTGSTDDCISTWLLICRVLKQMSSYDPDAFQTLYEVGELDDEITDSTDDYDDMPMVF